MTPFHSTSKADFCFLKIPCVWKICSKPRTQKNSPATGVRSINRTTSLYHEKMLMAVKGKC